jgi:membrane dipeptidase
MEIARAPVIASHSSARAFTPGFERNMSDDMIRRLAASGGVIQVNFGSPFLTPDANKWFSEFIGAREAHREEHGLGDNAEELKQFELEYREKVPFPYATLDDLLAHIDHIVGLVGVDHVGLGSDFEGVGDSLPLGVKDVSGYPNLVQGLRDRGYSEEDIRKIMGENLMRVWAEVEAYAARIRESAT